MESKRNSSKPKPIAPKPSNSKQQSPPNSSNKSASNSNKTQPEKTSRPSDLGNSKDRRENFQKPKNNRYRYSNLNKKDQKRDRNHYKPNYDAKRNLNRRPNQGWKPSGKKYGNRVWQRPYSNSKHSNDGFPHVNFQNFINFQREDGEEYNCNQQPWQPIDFFRDYGPPYPFQDNADYMFQGFQSQNFTENCDTVVVDGENNEAGEVALTNSLDEQNCQDTSLENVNQEVNPDQTIQPFPLELLTRQNQEEVAFNEPEPFENLSTSCQEEIALDQSQQINDFNQEEFLANLIKSEVEPELDPSNIDLFANLEAELPEQEFTLNNCINSSNNTPSISVIPISRLIKSELQDLNRSDIIAATTPIRGKRALRPNLVQRKKGTTKDGSLSENLVQRVANMDKVGIKNVINSSGTKYDAALQIQARKRLREEIRKQLKSMNFTPPEDNENNVLVPDEIVDSMNIPAVLLDEIRKAFGIVLVEDKKIKMPEEADKPVNPPASVSETPAVPIETVTTPTEEPPKSPDLMSRIKMLEECKSQSERNSSSNNSERRRKSKSTEPILVIDSSSSSSSCSSSSSDSETSSTSSGSDCSTTSSFKRRRRKKRILEANVVGNFEKLILPNLTAAQRRRYKDKYSKTTKSSLLYIYGVCVSRANCSENPADQKERLKLKKNLSSADNAQALEFLMKAILNLFEKQKETLRKNKEKKKSQTASSQMRSPNPVSGMANKLKDSTRNQRNSNDNIMNVEEEEQCKSASTVGITKHQSTSKSDRTSTEGCVNRRKEDSAAESANSAPRVSSDEGALVASDFESEVEVMEVGNPSSSRVWKSPGEKKCIEIKSISPLSNLGSLQPPLNMDTSAPLSSLGMIQPPLGNFSFDIDSLKSQGTIGDEAVTSIREIDVKLMELHKRKMYIEEMILKLQKDKMEVDLWTMKLQNEKFILLNSALASTSSSSGVIQKAVEVKKKPTSSQVLEILRNRKKRSQQDVPLEDTDDRHKVAKEQSSVVIPKPRQTERSVNSDEGPSTRKRTKSSKINKKSEAPAKIANELNSEKVAKSLEKIDEEEVKIVEMQKYDYSNVPNGNLEGWKLPITQIVVVGEAVIAASEDGNIYKFNINTRVLESKFSKHTEAITQIFTCPRENFVYTTSLDGFLRKTSIENFGLELLSRNLQEPLQSIDIEWGTAFIGSRWGNIFTYNIKNNSLSESLLCSSGSSIIAIKATKEGPRKILIVSSKGNQINFRDAMTGLLLRSLEVSENLHIYSILLDDASVFCGTQRNEIHQYNFTTGERLAIFRCGNGAVSMKLYKDKYIFVGCYDGFVYVLDKNTGCQIGRFPGSGKMILALEIAGDKLLTSAKDNTMQIIDIPKYIVTIKDKS